jgi:hypothetical protein
MIAMRLACRVLGWLLLIVALPLILLGVLSLPAGGLMFALPFVFLIPGFALAALAVLLLFLTRRPKRNSAGG